jgi:hypothetical protein
MEPGSVAAQEPKQLVLTHHSYGSPENQKNTQRGGQKTYLELKVP